MPSSERGWARKESEVHAVVKREDFSPTSALTQQGGSGTSRRIAKMDLRQKPVLAASVWNKEALPERVEGNRCYHGLVLWLQRETGNVPVTTGLGRGAYSFTAPMTPSHQTAFVRSCLI